MAALFVALTHALASAPPAALAAAAAWGVLSVLLSPCHLASIPLIVGFIDGRGRLSTSRAFVLSSLFATGILLSIAVLGALTAAAGRMFGDIGVWGNWLVATVFFLVGLHLLDLLPTPWTAPEVRISRKGWVPALLLGLLFGIALGPCTFAFMAPVLGIALGLAGKDGLYGVLLLVAYGMGHCAVIVCAGTFTQVLQRCLEWHERSRGTVFLKKACGVLVIAAGGWLLYSAPI